MKSNRTYVYGIRITENQRKQIMSDSRKYAVLIYDALSQVLEKERAIYDKERARELT